MTDRPSPSTSSSSSSNEAAEDFKQHLHELTGQWKSLLRRNKKVLLKCPNYEKCQYKCGSIGGMQYHYPRCAGACPMFKCNLCGREYESRTGLNYHNASHHTGVGVVLSSESGKRTQRKERRTDSSEGTTPTSSPAAPPVQAPPPSKSPDTLVPMDTPSISFSNSPPLSFITTTTTSSTHILPSLLKHSANPSTTTTTSTGKGRKGGRGSRSNKSTDVESGSIAMEGVVKTSSGKDKKVTVNIPSIEYPDKYRSYLPEWRDQLKANQTVLCPNYDECQFQCTTVNGMKYHFIRCQKDKLPEFSCSLCDRSFHCRSGLVWHLKNTHKLVDIPPNQKSFEVSKPTSTKTVEGKGTGKGKGGETVGEGKGVKGVTGGGGGAGGVKKEETSTTNRDNVRASRKRKPHPQETPTPPVAKVYPKRQSPRKNAYPRPTAKFYLKYLETQEKPVSYVKPMPTAWYGSRPPTPKLHPQPDRTPVSPTEFTLVHEVETDADMAKSLSVEYSEETLTQWHKWESSESEEDEGCYDDNDEEYSVRGPAHSRRVYRDSSTTCSEVSSDEDYMGYTQAKGKGGKGRGRGKRRKKGAAEGNDKPPFIPPIPSLLTTTSSNKIVGHVKHVIPELVHDTRPSLPVHSITNRHVATPTSLSLHSSSKSVQELGSGPIPKPIIHEPKLSGISKPVKLVKPMKSISSAHAQSQIPSSPQKLVTMVGPGKGQSSTGSVITLSPGNYYQLQHVPATNIVPVQLVSPVTPTTPHVPSNGLVLVQQPGSHPQYATLQTSTPQKVSVIMNPRHVTLATLNSTPSSHGVITQFDGPKGGTKRKLTSQADKEQLDKEFERVRKKAKLLSATDKQEETKTTEDTTTTQKTPKKKKGGRKTTQDPDTPTETTPTSGLATPIPEQTTTNTVKTPMKRRGRKSKQDSTETITNDQTTPTVGLATPTTEQTTTGEETTLTTDQTTPSVTERQLGKGKQQQKTKEGFVCSNCSKSFPNQRAYKTHIETTHLPLSPEATIAERQPHWRNSIKKHKYVTCDKCNEYKGKSVTAMKYHYERCQISDEAQKKSYTCPTCQKTYTSMPGLNYHLKYAHVEPLSSKESTPVDTNPSSSTSSQRRAAGSAAKKLREICEVPHTPETPSLSVTDDGEDILPPANNDDHLINKAAKKAMKATLQKEGMVECPKEGCDQTYTTMPGLLYHVRTRHIYGKKFRCPKCKALLLSKKKIVNHMNKKHPDYQVDDYDDLEYIPDGGGGEDDSSDSESGDEEDYNIVDRDEGGKKKGGGATPGGSSSSSGGGSRSIVFKMFDTTSYKKMLEILKSKLLSDEPLYEEYRAVRDDYSMVSDSDLCEYIPESSTSIRYDDVSNDINEESVALFQTSSTGVFFAGGPVWALDWLPFREPDSGSTQYVALSAYRQLAEVHSIEDIQVYKGLIQLWRVENLKNDPDSCPVVKLSLGICHEWGIIRNVKWCPSGTTDTSSSSENETHLPRLGLLAVACSDGNIRLLSVPRPSSMTFDPSMRRVPFIKPNKVSAVLQPCRHDNLYKYGQCLCMDWSPGGGHSRIAAGYSNGSIVIWNLSTTTTTTLPFLSSSSCSSSLHSCYTLHNPSIILPGHHGACRGVTWLPCTDYHLSSVGHDKALCIWDIRQPHQPLQKSERPVIQLKVLAPLVWPSLIVLEDICSASQSLYLSWLIQFIRSLKQIPTSNHPIASVDYNDWSDCMVSGLYGGDIVGMEFSKGAHYNPNVKNLIKRKFKVLSSKLEKLTTPSKLTNERPSCHSYSVNQILDNFKLVFRQDHTQQVKEEDSTEHYSNEVIPLSAITSLSWSPHSDSHHWLMAGMNCGLVKIIRT